MSEFPSKVTIASVKQRILNWTSDESPFGIEGIFIDQLFKDALKTKYEMIVSVDGDWGKLLENGSWSGVIGMVSRGEADIGCSYLTITESRKTVVDFSEHYTESNMAFATYLPSMKAKSLVFIYPFDWITWVGMLICMLALPLLVKRIGISYIESLFIIVGNLLRQDPCPKKANKTTVFGCWWLEGSIFSMCYAAVISSFLLVPLYEQPVKNFYELSRATKRGEYALLYASLAIEKNFLYSQQDHLVTIAYSMQNNPFLVPNDHRIEEVDTFGMKKAFLKSELGLYLEFGKPPFSSMYISKEGGVKVDMGIAVAKNFCCMDALNKAIWNIKRAGLYEKNINDEMYKLWIRSFDKKKDIEIVRPISLSDTMGMFLVLFIGYSLAFLCLLVEIIIRTCKKKNVEDHPNVSALIL